MFSNTSNPLHVKNGGLIGLAGTAIALGVDVSPYMDKFIEPLLVCFSDPENRIRYFSAECLYNIAKVSKGEILVYFNAIFDALSKVRLVLSQFAPGELSLLNCMTVGSRLRTVCKEWCGAVRSLTEGHRGRVGFGICTTSLRRREDQATSRAVPESRHPGPNTGRDERAWHAEEGFLFSEFHPPPI